MAVNFGVNYVAVIVAAIVTVVIGVVYYGPPGIAYALAKAIGATRERQAPPAAAGAAMGALISLINAWVLALFARNLSGTSVSDGILLGVLAWLGFIATVTGAQVAFDRRPWGWWTVDNVHHVVVQALMGAIVTAWR